MLCVFLGISEVGLKSNRSTSFFSPVASEGEIPAVVRGEGRGGETEEGAAAKEEE